MFRRIGLIAKADDPRVAETLATLSAYLERREVEYCVETSTHSALGATGAPASDLGRIAADCDLALVVGGDGTLLAAARALVDHDVRLLGINLGRLGFLTDISPCDLEARLDEVLAGQFLEERRFLLEAGIVRGGTRIHHTISLNDVVVHKWRIARLVELDVYVDGVFVNRQRSDGLIVSTPTGSTGYALSGGGPILHPALNAVVLVPICPHTLSNRPIVVDAASHIEVTLSEREHTSAQLTCDGQTAMDLEAGDKVEVRRKARPIRLIHPPGHDYYAMLRTKLHWSR
jgi:NAD+ kinase